MIDCRSESDGGPLHGLDARVKLVVFPGVALVAVSTPSSAHDCLVGLGLILVALVVVGRVSCAEIFRRLVLLVPFLLVAAVLPLTRPDLGWNLAVGETSKAIIGCLALVLLAATTPVDRLLTGLAGLRCPRTVVLLLGFLLRYLHLLGDEARRLHRSALLRGYRARILAQAGVIGGLIGALFLRSHARAERVHGAMLARGFDGQAVDGVQPRLCPADAAFLVVVGALAAFVRMAA